MIDNIEMLNLIAKIKAILEAYNAIKMTPDTKEYDDLSESIYEANMAIRNTNDENYMVLNNNGGTDGQEV